MRDDGPPLERGDPTHLTVAVVRKAVGLRGEVEISVSTDHGNRFAVGARLLVRPGLRALVVRSARHRRSGLVVAFEEVADRAGAEALLGAELVVPISEARPLESDEYWDHDLVGCEVTTTAGDRVGHVADVLHTPANEVLVVTQGEREYLVPFVSQVVRGVERGRITIEPIPGLLDD